MRGPIFYHKFSRAYALQIAGGQGTIAFELLAQLPSGGLDAVFVPVGGGGLISGVSAFHCSAAIALTILYDGRLHPLSLLLLSIHLHAAGIASVLAAHKPRVKVVGCQPENSCIMANSVEAGNIVNSHSSPTLSEGTAGTDAITAAGSFSGFKCTKFTYIHRTGSLIWPGEAVTLLLA